MNPEDLLTDAFRDRTAHTDYPSTPMSTVAARAGAIRARRRRTTVLAAAAAVALVAVPSALWLGRSPGSSPQPGQTLSSGPTTRPSADSGPLSLDNLPMGQKPGIDYLVGDTYVTMNGDRITHSLLTKAVAATPVRGGILVSTRSRLSGLGDLVLETDGGDQRLGCGSDRFAMSTDGTESAYWLMDSCTVGSAGRLYSGLNSTMGESGPGYAATPAGSVYEPIGIVRQGTVVNVTNGSAEHSEIVDASGTESPIPGLAFAGGSDENNDVVSGVLSDGSTGAVVDASTGAVKWQTPWILGQFSTDGRYVLGVQPVDGAAMGNDYAVFDAITGTKLLGFTNESQPVWDFNDTLLTVEGGANTSAIVRTGLEGNRTLATPIVQGASYGDGGYLLATRP